MGSIQVAKNAGRRFFWPNWKTIHSAPVAIKDRIAKGQDGARNVGTRLKAANGIEGPMEIQRFVRNAGLIRVWNTMPIAKTANVNLTANGELEKVNSGHVLPEQKRLLVIT